MWSDGDRFPLGRAGGTLSISPEPPSGPASRPFGLRSVVYTSSSPTGADPRTTAHEWGWCESRQIGLIDGRPSFECDGAPSMTQTESDGKDVLSVDYSEDDPAEDTSEDN